VLGQVELLPPTSEYEVPPTQAVAVPAEGGFFPQVGQPIVPDTVPVLPDAVPAEPLIGPAWYNPAGWIGPYWDGSVELGLSGSGGNSDANSLRTGFDVTRETPRTKWAMDLVYAKNESNNVETQHSALFNSNWDYKLANPRWTAYSRLGLEYDEFRAFDLRLSLNGGLGYHFIMTPITKLRGRFGAGASREIDSVDDDWKPEADLGIDFEHKISDRQGVEFTTDYYPTWEDFSDYRLVTDASWKLVLDAESNLSLKVSVIDRYDSTPGGAKHNDIDYAVLLLWAL
jgi:putative salt-induced outer membrane protein YdiY